MEFLTVLSEALQPYKDVVAMVAMVVTIIQLLSPAMILLEIRKSGSTKNHSIIPFMGGFVMCVLFIKFGMLIGDEATSKVNFIGLFLSISYLAVFYIYTPIEDKFSLWGRMGAGFAFVAAAIGYTNYEDPELVEQRFGLFLTLLLYALIASPMLSLGDVIKNKSTEGLPFPIILSGTLVSLSWLIYGIILNSGFMVAQNIVAVLLGGFQLALFVIYPSKPAKAVKASKKKN